MKSLDIYKTLPLNIENLIREHSLNISTYNFYLIKIVLMHDEIGMYSWKTSFFFFFKECQCFDLC